MGRGRSQGGLLYDSQVPDFNLTNQTRGQLPAAEGQTKIGRQQKRKLYRSFDSGLSSNNGIFTISVNNPTPRLVSCSSGVGGREGVISGTSLV